MKTGLDLRRYPRMDYRGLVHVGDGELYPVQALDISQQGLGVVSATALEPGTPVQVAFLNRSVAVRGRVKFARRIEASQWRIGLEFDRPEPEILDVLLRLQPSS